MSRGPMQFRSGDDAARAAVTPLLDELRGELLVLPREAVVEKHLDMMAFEQRVLTTAPRVERPARRVGSRPRRTAFVAGCIAATLAGCGLSAAGALPEPLQHITDSIAHTLGVPRPHDSGTSTGTGAIPGNETTVPPAARPRVSRPSTQPTVASTPTTTPVHRKARVKTHDTTVHTPPPPPTPTTLPPAFPARPTDPGRRVTPTPPPTTTPPSNNSDNTPPGYPTDWRAQAIDSMTSQLELCTWWDVASPPACPQSAAVPPGAQNLAWRLLNDPTHTAAAVAKTTKSANGEPTTLVTVYERWRMSLTYTLSETGAQQHVVYTYGIAEATMTWSGTTFANVELVNGPVHVMAGVVVPEFARPPVWDLWVAWAVERAFERCTANGSPDATCPAGGLLDSPSTNQSTLNGDVMAAAEVSFDGQTGLFRVTGTYSLTPPSGSAVTGIYDATLFSDGNQLTILSVTGR